MSGEADEGTRTPDPLLTIYAREKAKLLEQCLRVRAPEAREDLGSRVARRRYALRGGR